MVVYIEKVFFAVIASLIFGLPKESIHLILLNIECLFLFSLCKGFASDPIKTHPKEDDSHIIILYLNEDSKGDI